MATLSVKGIRKSFGAVEVLKNIDIELDDGGFLVLLGPSGCGKSTLLGIVAGLESASAGDILIGDRLVTDVHPKDRNIAMVFQSYALYPTMSVRQNIGFGLEMRKVDKATREAAVLKAAQMLQVEHLLDRKPGQLSGGQRQRVAMGRAIVRAPDLFLFDEPLSNLDAKLRVEMRTEIKRLHNRLGTTIVYVTHDQVEAMTLGTKVAVMKEGVIQQLADPQTIYDRPANMFVAGFIGSPAMNFLYGTLVPDPSGPVLQLDGADAPALPLGPIEQATDPYLGRPVALGIRPETLRPVAEGAAGAIHAVVDMVEPTGPDVMVSARIADQFVIARLGPRHRPSPGDSIWLDIEPGTLNVFDPASGQRI